MLLFQDFLTVQHVVHKWMERDAATQNINLIYPIYQRSKRQYRDEMFHNRRPTSCDERRKEAELSAPISFVWSNRVLSLMEIFQWWYANQLKRQKWMIHGWWNKINLFLEN